ncbi:hypothetical protein BDU57DRAFT_511587 [Ampelomyces quisqualis]|uniref:Uncharacterized protein n=1 Tax=Ampelomyces quisqualis TaxID=50730 RepID=A0A6A5QT47_AMPQU|nr:hypothetical protein BDU57DRAFT_511587 [Ampelomyces quisqualis]
MAPYIACFMERTSLYFVFDNKWVVQFEACISISCMICNSCIELGAAIHEIEGKYRVLVSISLLRLPLSVTSVLSYLFMLIYLY